MARKKAATKPSIKTKPNDVTLRLNEVETATLSSILNYYLELIAQNIVNSVQGPDVVIDMVNYFGKEVVVVSQVLAKLKLQQEKKHKKEDKK
jgi:hypothetical protein